MCADSLKPFRDPLGGLLQAGGESMVVRREFSR
jgi:hypothetical protein